MTRKTFVATVAATSLAVAIAATPMRPAKAQLVVFDVSNFVENILQATYMLQQINNEVQSLQNEAVMLDNMAKNLQRLDVSSLNQMVSKLSQVSSLMDQAQGIAFDVSATQSAFARYYPEQYAAAVGTNQLVADAQQRWQQSMDAFQQTLVIQAQVAGNVEADTGTLADLVTASQGSAGSLEAQQATNQLIALSIKQQLQVQSLMAAQYRAEALDQARNAEAEEEARAAFTNFLGQSNAYTPQ
jgi:type IV secretion system protein TrbJ